jgi:hypothetical protein
MNQLKDLLQAGAWLASVLLAILTVVKFWSETKLSREQRERDLRWRQAQAAKELNDEMLTDPEAWAALQMIDSEGARSFKLPSEKFAQIGQGDIVAALANTNDVDEKPAYIRDCFDSLFYYMAMLQHYQQSTLIQSADVEFPIHYYLSRLRDLEPPVREYIDRFKLDRTKQFLQAHAQRPRVAQSAAKPRPALEAAAASGSASAL